MTTTRSFRFGVAAAAPPATAGAWRDLARKAEDLGYSTLLLADHMGRQPAALIAAMAALDATDHLRLGTQVLANPFRNPVVLAKELATIDFLSEGRFEPGIGAGWPATSAIGQADAGQTGIDLGASGVRVERLRETVQILRRFFESAEPFDYLGTHYKLTGVVPEPRPVQQGGPPIMIAGAGPRLMRVAAEEADIINIAPRPAIVGPTNRGSMGFGLTMADEVALIKEAAGARYDEIELCVFSNNPSADNPSVSDHPEGAIERLAAELSTSVEEAASMPATLVGPLEALIERIESDRERYDISYRTIPATAIDEFAPIVARLAGH